MSNFASLSHLVSLFSNYELLFKSLINENCHNSRISNDIHETHGPVTKLDQRNTIISEKLENDVKSAIYYVTVIFPNYGSFGAI